MCHCVTINSAFSPSRIARTEKSRVNLRAKFERAIILDNVASAGCIARTTLRAFIQRSRSESSQQTDWTVRLIRVACFLRVKSKLIFHYTFLNCKSNRSGVSWARAIVSDHMMSVTTSGRRNATITLPHRDMQFTRSTVMNTDRDIYSYITRVCREIAVFDAQRDRIPSTLAIHPAFGFKRSRKKFPNNIYMLSLFLSLSFSLFLFCAIFYMHLRRGKSKSSAFSFQKCGFPRFNPRSSVLRGGRAD